MPVMELFQEEMAIQTCCFLANVECNASLLSLGWLWGLRSGFLHLNGSIEGLREERSAKGSGYIGYYTVLAKVES